jgi:hypothetical protein
MFSGAEHMAVEAVAEQAHENGQSMGGLTL